MADKYKEMLKVRVTSTSFVVLALAVFKPFWIDASSWAMYAHFLVILVLGVAICLLSETILIKLLKMPLTSDRGVGYIIHRNIYFQLINTPLVALMICLYRHFMLSDVVEDNQLSWGNYLESLLIIAFCSFVIGQYWRFKYRSKYLAIELEETSRLNEQLCQLQKQKEGELETAGAVIAEAKSENASAFITLTGTTIERVVVEVANLLYVESAGNYVNVCLLKDGKSGTISLRATSQHVEEELSGYPTVVRCHRAFLVNLLQVEEIRLVEGKMALKMRLCDKEIPVSRQHKSGIRAALKDQVTNYR